MSKKMETARVAQYLVAKDGKTKYLKFEASPKAPKEVHDLVDRIKEAIGGDVMYVNLFDEAFRREHNIKDFVKGNIQVELKGSGASKSGKKQSNDEVDF